MADWYFRTMADWFILIRLTFYCNIENICLYKVIILFFNRVNKTGTWKGKALLLTLQRRLLCSWKFIYTIFIRIYPSCFLPLAAVQYMVSIPWRTNTLGSFVEFFAVQYLIDQIRINHKQWSSKKKVKSKRRNVFLIYSATRACMVVRCW